MFCLPWMCGTHLLHLSPNNGAVCVHDSKQLTYFNVADWPYSKCMAMLNICLQQIDSNDKTGAGSGCLCYASNLWRHHHNSFLGNRLGYPQC